MMTTTAVSPKGAVAVKVNRHIAAKPQAAAPTANATTAPPFVKPPSLTVPVDFNKFDPLSPREVDARNAAGIPLPPANASAAKSGTSPIAESPTDKNDL